MPIQVRPVQGQEQLPLRPLLLLLLLRPQAQPQGGQLRRGRQGRPAEEGRPGSGGGPRERR